MTRIHECSCEIVERRVPGYWEGDLIKGARNASAIGTLVERTTLFVTLAKLENASAEAAVPDSVLFSTASTPSAACR